MRKGIRVLFFNCFVNYHTVLDQDLLLEEKGEKQMNVATLTLSQISCPGLSAEWKSDWQWKQSVLALLFFLKFMVLLKTAYVTKALD